MPKFAKQFLNRTKLTRAYNACRAGRADPLQKAIKTLCLKVEELAELAEPDAVHTDAHWLEGFVIHHVEVTEDGTVHVGAMIPADFVFSEIVEELRPFIIAEDPSPPASKP
jgi:hypothetical protein